MSQQQPLPPPQLRVLRWNLNKLHRQSDSIFVKSTLDEIHKAVINAWRKEHEDLVEVVSNNLAKNGVALDDAKQLAEAFIYEIEKINGVEPKVFQQFDDVKAIIRALILNLPLTAQAKEVLLNDEARYPYYSNYGYKFMQVRFPTIVVRVGRKKQDIENSSIVDLKFKEPIKVQSPIPLLGLEIVDLKEKFKNFIKGKSANFWKDLKLMTYEKSYLKHSANVLLNIMFEKGIDLTGKTVEQIRENVLRNVKYKGLTNFDDIDKVLDQLISFLAQTYVYA